MTLHVRDRVGSLARREPIFVGPQETLRTASEKLWAESVGLLNMGEARNPLGVISERDVVAMLARGADLDATTANDAMTAYIVSAGPQDPFFDIAAQMIDDKVRHLPVVGENDDVVGMVLLRPLLIDSLGGSISTDSPVP